MDSEKLRKHTILTENDFLNLNESKLKELATERKVSLALLIQTSNYLSALQLGEKPMYVPNGISEMKKILAPSVINKLKEGAERFNTGAVNPASWGPGNESTDATPEWFTSMLKGAVNKSIKNKRAFNYWLRNNSGSQKVRNMRKDLPGRYDAPLSDALISSMQESQEVSSNTPVNEAHSKNSKENLTEQQRIMFERALKDLAVIAKNNPDLMMQALTKSRLDDEGKTILMGALATADEEDDHEAVHSLGLSIKDLDAMNLYIYGERDAFRRQLDILVALSDKYPRALEVAIMRSDFKRDLPEGDKRLFLSAIHSDRRDDEELEARRLGIGPTDFITLDSWIRSAISSADKIEFENESLREEFICSHIQNHKALYFISNTSNLSTQNSAAAAVESKESGSIDGMEKVTSQPKVLVEDKDDQPEDVARIKEVISFLENEIFPALNGLFNAVDASDKNELSKIPELLKSKQIPISDIIPNIERIIRRLPPQTDNNGYVIEKEPYIDAIRAKMNEFLSSGSKPQIDAVPDRGGNMEIYKVPAEDNIATDQNKSNTAIRASKQTLSAIGDSNRIFYESTVAQQEFFKQQLTDRFKTYDECLDYYKSATDDQKEVLKKMWEGATLLANEMSVANGLYEILKKDGRIKSKKQSEIEKAESNKPTSGVESAVNQEELNKEREGALRAAGLSDDEINKFKLLIPILPKAINYLFSNNKTFIKVIIENSRISKFDIEGVKSFFTDVLVPAYDRIQKFTDIRMRFEKPLDLYNSLKTSLVFRDLKDSQIIAMALELWNGTYDLKDAEVVQLRQSLMKSAVITGRNIGDTQNAQLADFPVSAQQVAPSGAHVGDAHTPVENPVTPAAAAVGNAGVHAVAPVAGKVAAAAATPAAQQVGAGHAVSGGQAAAKAGAHGAHPAPTVGHGHGEKHGTSETESLPPITSRAEFDKAIMQNLFSGTDYSFPDADYRKAKNWLAKMPWWKRYTMYTLFGGSFFFGGLAGASFMPGIASAIFAYFGTTIGSAGLAASAFGGGVLGAGVGAQVGTKILNKKYGAGGISFFKRGQMAAEYLSAERSYSNEIKNLKRAKSGEGILGARYDHTLAIDRTRLEQRMKNAGLIDRIMQYGLGAVGVLAAGTAAHEVLRDPTLVVAPQDTK
jgi:hypothetical protein